MAKETQIVESSDRYGRLYVAEPPFLLFSTVKDNSSFDIAQEVQRHYFEAERVFDCWSEIALSVYLLNSGFNPALSKQIHRENGRDMVYFHTTAIGRGIMPDLNLRLVTEFIRNHRKNERKVNLELRGFHLALRLP